MKGPHDDEECTHIRKRTGMSEVGVTVADNQDI